MDDLEAYDPVVITGVGMVTPFAGDREQTWQAVLRGQSAARPLSLPDLRGHSHTTHNQFSRWIGCPADRSLTLADDPLVDLALRSSREAIHDAELTDAAVEPARLGCVFGTSKGSLFAATELWSQHSKDPSFALRTLLGPAVSAQAIAAERRLSGPVLCPVAACATGVAAALRGAELIRQGDCDAVIAGSADDSLHPLVLASFQRLGILAPPEHPETASRPFDRRRRGFVVGAGAGCLILERRSHAQRRGKQWYAVVGPGRLQSDPTGITSLDTSGSVLAHMIKSCWKSFDPSAATVPDVVNLHGTGTRQNDPAECRALQLVFGDRLASVSCGSLKGGLGHLLGAAGSVELGLCCLMLRDQIVPATVNLNDVDDDCRLSWVRNQPVRRSIESLLKISLGFGGQQAVLLLRRGPLQGQTPERPTS